MKIPLYRIETIGSLMRVTHHDSQWLTPLSETLDSLKKSKNNSKAINQDAIKTSNEF